MTGVGVLARFEAMPGSEREMADFFKEGLPLVEAQPRTTVWFAYRIDEMTYGAFAAFANEQDREALLSSGGPQLATRYGQLFRTAPTFDRVDLLEARLAT